jgi:hypothetical protein
MPTHAELAGRLLNDAAAFFRTLGQENQALQKQMEENASVFEQIGQLVVTQPAGAINEKPHAELAARLLGDAAAFFETLGQQNPPLREQMEENARVFRQIGALVHENPLGILE